MACTTVRRASTPATWPRYSALAWMSSSGDSDDDTSRFIQISGPDPRKHVKIDYVAGPDTITIRGPVWTGDPDEGGWCEPWGPLATYSWTVSDGRLTLTPSGRPDACKQRGAVLTGAWARVK